MRDHNVHTDDGLAELKFELLAGQPGSFIEQILSRANAGVPEWFVPSAARVAVVTDRALHWVNIFSPRSYPRGSWAGDPRSGDNQLITVIPDGWLVVRRYGTFWSMEREIHSGSIHEVLGFDGDCTPILHSNCRAAMALAKRCHPAPPIQAPRLSWLPGAGYGVDLPRTVAAKCKRAS